MSRAVSGLALVLWACVAAAGAAEKDFSIPVMAGWRAKPAADAKGLADQFFRLDFDDSAWEKADVKDAEDPYKDRYVFYRRWVDVPAAWKGKKITITFGGVDDDCAVWWNGQKVGDHKGWDSEFDLDLTAGAKPGERNLLAVLADNSGGGGCGIWKPVSLLLADELGKAREARAVEMRAALKLGDIPHRIVFETFRGGNWEICAVNADGSNLVNLTNTPDVGELYPHVSPDGTKVSFIAEEGEGQKRTRTAYYMNIDGTGRTKVAEKAREACWSPDGSAIAYLKAEFDRFVYEDFATKGVGFYDLKTGKLSDHPNDKLFHLYNLCWSPDGKWFVATVHGGMGFNHAILAFEANGTKVYNLGIPGCRPDISPDGKKIAWGASDWDLDIGDLDFSSGTPKVVNRRVVCHNDKPIRIYHIDWSPDGKYVTFSRGPSAHVLGYAPEIIGVKAKGWDICVADANGKSVWAPITSDGECNKEPDWAPVSVKSVK